MRNKLFNLILVMLFWMLMVPGVVMAEVTKVGDIVYTFEEKDIYDYLCADVKGHELGVSVSYKEGNLVVHDMTDGKNYLIDLDKEPACNVGEESFNDSEYYIEYVWDKDNRLFMDKVYENRLTIFVKTKDEKRDIYKSYYEIIEEEDENGTFQYFDRVIDIKEENMDEYYELVYAKLAEGEFDASEDYYYLNFETDTVELVELDENTYEVGKYYLVDGVIERELLAEFPTDKFIMSKEKTGLAEDVTFTNGMHPDYFVLNGKKYFAFSNWNDSLMTAVTGIFDENGVYQTFGFEKINVVGYDYSGSGYLSLVIENEDKNTWLLYNEKFELVSSVNGNIDQVRAAKYSDSYEYYIKYNYTDGSEKIVKVNKYYLMTEGELKYNNSDLVIKFSGEFDKLTSVKVNDIELDINNYTVVSGSTVVTLKNDYLKGLKAGTYTLKVEYNDGGYVETLFVVGGTNTIDNPNTFDGGLSYIVMAVISLVGIVVIAIVSLKKVTNKD